MFSANFIYSVVRESRHLFWAYEFGEDEGGLF